MKQCTKCNKLLSKDSFSRKGNNLTTLSSWCKLCKNKYAKEHFSRNKSTIKTKRKIFRESNLEKIHTQEKNLRFSRIKSWENYIPKVAKCQMCGKTIFFNEKNPSKAIHFDHRFEGNEPIKGSPTKWLIGHERNKRWQRIWDECYFGYLCGDCNRCLPTKNREQFYLNLGRYLYGK